MVIISNGQSSGSDSDSKKRRFYKKTGKSQRQQSSTSTSLSDSEPEQVSTRQAAEKPASATTHSSKKTPEAPPSHKKKPDASGRSAVRNHGIPSEPNPKAPSASKPKSVAAGKRAKDDDAAEEKPEPKKKLASKGKKHVEEEAAPSNPKKKKAWKQQQEFETVVAAAAPPAKHSPQESSKKKAHVWTDNVETVIMHGWERIMKETRDRLNEFIRDVKKLVENSEVQTRALLDSHLGLANGTSNPGGGAGRRVNSAVWLTNKGSDLEGIYSIREIPVVDEARVQEMEQIWRNAQILRLEMNSYKFELLQKKLSMQIEALKETNGKCQILVATCFIS